jgi:EAL domain-containing protein (putative c-di-GMP-specific phosphodiesterase class I)
VEQSTLRRTDSVDEIIDGALVRSVYQPIVNLETGDVVAYEALARGPVGSALERPDLLFAAAAETGRLADLDWVCRAAAVTGAIDAQLPAGIALFVNVEPEALGSDCPPHLLALFATAAERLRIVVEITERALFVDPASLLRRVETIRELGWGVALDDVGADPASLALLPLVAPDVIKLDMTLVQRRADRGMAEVMNAVLAHAERTGAVILAEGVEDDAHLQRARSMGAIYGPGWHFGRPGPAPVGRDQPAAPAEALPIPSTWVPADTTTTPYDAVAEARCPGRVAPKDLLLPMSHHLERKALDLAEAPLVLTTFQDAVHLTPATRRRYARLVERAALVGALGAGVGPEPCPGVRGGPLLAGDRLAGEWNVVVLSAHFAGALIARDLGDDGPDRERRFAYHLVYDRDLVIDAARRMLLEVAPLGSPVVTG